MLYRMNQEQAYCREILSSRLNTYYKFPMRVKTAWLSTRISRDYIDVAKEVIQKIFNVTIKNIQTENFSTYMTCNGYLQTPFDVGAFFFVFMSNIDPDNPMIESRARRNIRKSMNLGFETRLYLALRKEGRLRNIENVTFPSSGGGPAYLIRWILHNGIPNDYLDATVEEIDELLKQFSQYFFVRKRLPRINIQYADLFKYDENSNIILWR